METGVPSPLRGLPGVTAVQSQRSRPCWWAQDTDTLLASCNCSWLPQQQAHGFRVSCPIPPSQAPSPGLEEVYEAVRKVVSCPQTQISQLSLALEKKGAKPGQVPAGGCI